MTKSPHELSDDQMTLSEEYSRYAGRYADCIKKQADYFNLHRPEHKSDNATQKAFDTTSDGVTMAVLKMKLKSIEKRMSAIRTHLRMLDSEAHNLY